MSKQPMPFESFIQLMETNWNPAFQSLFPLFPKIERIAADLNHHIAKIMLARGLQESDFQFLTALRRSSERPPYELMPSEICEYMLFSWGGVAKVMQRLEQQGIIVRVACLKDKRVRMVRLTNQGLLLIEAAAAELLNIHRSLLINFTNEEVLLLERLLGKLLDEIEN